MLAAVLNGKRRGTGFAGKRLTLGETDGAEDVLTATIFERVAYLPDSVFESFFKALLELDEPIGILEELLFWPSWSLSDQRIEPDVVLHGSARTLLVEAKRYDDGLQQYAAQLVRELQAGFEEDVLGENPVLLTIGGMLDYSESTTSGLSDQVRAKLSPDFPDFELFCRSWHQVFRALNIAITTADADGITGLRRLADDIAEVYEWHGLRTSPHRRLEDLKPVGISEIKYPVNMSRIDKVAIHQSEPFRFSKPLIELQSPHISYIAFPIYIKSSH